MPVVAAAFDDILIAANEGRTGVVIDLMQRGMDANTTDRDGTSLLGIAARAGNLELAKLLLQNRASPHRKNRYGDTPLLLATSQGHTAIMQVLLDAGAELNPVGWTPLHYACVANKIDLATWLLDKGAKPDLLAPNGLSSLMLAVRSGNNELVGLLIKRGANPLVKDYEGKTAKDHAKAAGFAQTAELLERK
jgi:ankyrin repeat protein